MSDDLPEKDPKQTEPEEKSDSGTSPTNSGAESPRSPVSEEDLIKEIKAENLEHIDTELIRGQEFAAVYINARRGVFSSRHKRSHRTKFAAPVSGDVHTGSGNIIHHHYTVVQSNEKAIGINQVLSEDLLKIRAVFVPPKTCDRAQSILTKQNVLILWGQENWGKTAAAYYLLSVLHADSVFEIDSDAELDHLFDAELGKKGGYVIDTLMSDRATKLDAFVLNRLAAKLRKQQNRLVITIDSRVRLAGEALKNYLVTWNDLPDRLQVLNKHLDWYLPDADLVTKARELVQKDIVQQLLSTHLLPGEIERLAELLVDVVQDELKLEDALSRFESRVTEQVETWFSEHTELDLRTFMLAVAVLNGASYESIAEADERLQSLLKPQTADEQPPVQHSAFSGTRSQRIVAVCAHQIPGYEETEFGPSPVEIVEFNNPAFQPAVLQYTWQEYDRLRKPLISWLRELGVEPAFGVRARAAAAIGKLSEYNFGYVRKEVVLPWANSEDSRARVAAGLALGIPAWDGELAPQVLGLLHHWSTLRNNWRLCWTSAVAYGGLVGLRFPDTALRGLYYIAQAEDSRLLGVLSRSLSNLFHAGQVVADYYIKVLAALSTWTSDPKDRIVTLTGLLIFLELALNEKVEADPGGEEWPTLLWLARESDTSRGQVTTLWRRALNTKSARQPALETLRRWLKIVDDDARLYPVLKELVITLATQGTSREEERLRTYLYRWASHPSDKSKSAGEILSLLNNKQSKEM